MYYYLCHEYYNRCDLTSQPVNELKCLASKIYLHGLSNYYCKEGCLIIYDTPFAE